MIKLTIIITTLITVALLYGVYQMGVMAGRNEIFTGFNYDIQLIENNCFNQLEREREFNDRFSGLSSKERKALKRLREAETAKDSGQIETARVGGLQASR